MRSGSMVAIILFAVGVAGCRPQSTPMSFTNNTTGVSINEVAQARAMYDQWTLDVEHSRQIHIARRTEANVAGFELFEAVREWNDPSLDPLAETFVRVRVWEALQAFQLQTFLCAPRDVAFDEDIQTPSIDAMLPADAEDQYKLLKQLLATWGQEHSGRWSSISNMRNRVETGIDEWDANLGDGEIAAFMRSEVEHQLDELQELVMWYRPSD